MVSAIATPCDASWFIILEQVVIWFTFARIQHQQFETFLGSFPFSMAHMVQLLHKKLDANAQHSMTAWIQFLQTAALLKKKLKLLELEGKVAGSRMLHAFEQLHWRQLHKFIWDFLQI